MMRFLAASLLLPVVAFAAQAPDTPLVTGPGFQQIPSGNVLVTPTGGTQQKLGDALSPAGINLNGANASGANVTATGGTAAVPLSTWMSYTLNPKAWNSAIGDGKTVAGTYSITSGQPNLSAVSSTWASGDVGKGISVPGAGVAAAALNTTIASFQDATHITLAANASTTITSSAVSVAFGTDAFPAFSSLITSVVSGASVRAAVPSGVYYLGTAVTSNGRIVTVDLAQGASVIGPGIIFVDVASSWSSSAPQTLYAGTGATANATVGPWVNIKNTGTAGVTGRRTNYTSNATITCCFDVAQVEGNVWAGAINGGQAQGYWQFAVSPNDPTGSTIWGVVNMEMNTSFRGLDTGWHASRYGDNSKQWTGGIQVVPESSTFGQTGTVTGNSLFAYGFMNSAAAMVSGVHAKTYNGLMGEPNSVAPDGRGVMLSGDNIGVSANYPHTPFQFAQTWKHGIRADTATLIDGNAMIMSIGQNLAWITGTVPSPTATATIGGTGTGADVGVNVATAGAGQFTVNGAALGFAPTTTVYTATTAGIAVPSGAVLMRVIARGQGGCGGGGAGLTTPFTGAGGGGGGGGSVKDTTWFPVSQVSGTATVTIGALCTAAAGGTAGGTGANGSAGANASFAMTGLDLITAFGGGGGAGAVGGAGATATGGGGGAGAIGAGSSSTNATGAAGGNFSGGAGGSGTQPANVTVAWVGSGGAGSSSTGVSQGGGFVVGGGSVGGGSGGGCNAGVTAAGGPAYTTMNAVNAGIGHVGQPAYGAWGGGGGGGGSGSATAGGVGANGGTGGGGGAGGGSGCAASSTGGNGGVGGIPEVTVQFQ